MVTRAEGNVAALLQARMQAWEATMSVRFQDTPILQWTKQGAAYFDDHLRAHPTAHTVWRRRRWVLPGASQCVVCGRHRDCVVINT